MSSCKQGKNSERFGISDRTENPCKRPLSIQPTYSYRLFPGGILRRALMKTFKRNNGSLVDLNEPVVIDICMTCDLYQNLTTTFTQLRLEIVAGMLFIVK